MIAGIFHDWFGWPNGAVLTNLVASAICVGFGVWRIVKSHRKLHKHVAELHTHVLDLHRHHGVETTKHEDG